ncbi:MAG TPA: hypothetical protein VMT81_03045 [Candidatus Paceibacterota bacterium]|nr:hypothetical protein [Candidatus Paceibacterota bacterium]
MKKTMILAALFMAIASYGGNTIPAHAQALTPAQTAALQQQLDVAKAQLVQLEMQQGMVPQGDSALPGAPATTVAPAAPSAAMTLSASDLTAIRTALSSLAGALTALQAKIAEDPQLATQNGPAMVAALQGIGNTVAVIGTELTGSNIAMSAPQPSQPQTSGASVAQVSPAMGSSNGGAGTAQATMPAAGGNPVAANTVPEASTTPIANAAPQAQTAQASSAFSFGNLNWPLVAVIILIIAAIVIWLWWDDSEDKGKKKPVAPKAPPVAPAPQKPVVVSVQTMGQPQVSVQTRPAAAAPVQTPMSAAMANQPKPQQ